jgi:hypothetical protein
MKNDEAGKGNINMHGKDYKIYFSQKIWREETILKTDA